MTVVINEFEILQEPGSPPPGTTTPAKVAAAELSDRDVEESLQRLRRRAARVRAT